MIACRPVRAVYHTVGGPDGGSGGSATQNSVEPAEGGDRVIRSDSSRTVIRPDLSRTAIVDPTGFCGTL